jgi:transposase
VVKAALREGGWPSALARGARRPSHLWQQPRVSLGTACRNVTHDRTVARLSIAWTRQVTVTDLICGVDVSADRLDAGLADNRLADSRLAEGGVVESFAQTPAGIAALAAFCREHGVGLVAMEATGGYERLAFGLLWTEGIPVAIVNPRAVRRFAEAMGFLEKTDRIDAGVIARFAGVIARFAAVKRIVPQPPASPTQQRLAALVTRLRQLTELRVAQSNQQRLVVEPAVRETFDELLALVARQTRALETQIAALIAADPLWRRLDEAFREIKGVADRTVARMMAELPEIGTLSNKAIGKLAGLAPLARDSGKTQGKRSIRGGRGTVRAILFTVAEIVRRYDPDFAQFHKRLTLAGKPKKVIRVALAHKLLTRLNAKARDVRHLSTCPT